MTYQLSDKNERNFSPTRAAWVNEQFSPNGETAARVEEIRRRGYTVIENSYTPDEVEYTKRAIETIYADQLEQSGGQKELEKSGDANIARQLLAYDEFFLGKATNPQVIDIVRSTMGEYFILYQQNGNLNRPNISNTTAPWHRDLTFWHMTSSRPLALSALHIVSAFTKENGAVWILPGSQKEEAFPSFPFVDANKELLVAPAGSICVLDSRMFHCSGTNTTDEIRYSINHMYTMPLITQQISLPRMLDGKWNDDPFLRGFLGYNCMQQASVKEWRSEKVKNARKQLKVK